MRAFGCCVLVVWLGATVRAEVEPVATEVFVSGLNSPIEFVQHPTDTSVQFVNEKAGRIRIIRNGQLQGTPFLDFVAKIDSGFEKGMLGLAFPDHYPTDPCFYVHYSNTGGDTVLARLRHLPGAPLTADPNSEEILLTLGQPAGNHNGGRLEFGPDGMLYMSLGDGGGGSGSGQNIGNWFSTILRLDVSRGPGSGYSIPSDNPFVGRDGLDEIWVMGLRNPWKFSFDKGLGGTGAMFIGDVGSFSREEISYVPPGTGGLNFGWNCREGFSVSNPGCTPPAGLPFVDPVHDYPRNEGNCVIGGYVYRGSSMPCNRGRYFYGDLSGKVWSLALDDGVAGDIRLHFTTPYSISSFGRDAVGELYVVGFNNGTIFRIVGTGVDGDGDGDGVVNLADHEQFDSCFGGPGSVQDGTECRCFDLDGDLDIDLQDFRTMQIQFVDP